MIEWLKPWLTRRHQQRELDLKALAEAILSQLKAQGVSGQRVDVEINPQTTDFPLWSETRRAVRPGIQPPPDAPSDTMTWSAWEREMNTCGHIPGWAYCRFGNRTTEDGMGFVFGHARGQFGIWQQVFSVCVADQEPSQTLLSCITHLRSGLGIGIFSDRDCAIDAAELAERVIEPSDDIDIRHVRSVWRSAGIIPSHNAHAHTGGGVYDIIGRSMETIMHGAPQRFS
jgi:hypothetical protein